MKILFLLLLLSFNSYSSESIPDEIITDILVRHEICVRDAKFNSLSVQEFSKIKDLCKNDYRSEMENNNKNDIIKNSNIFVEDFPGWINFINTFKYLKNFEIQREGNFYNRKVYLKLGEFEIRKGPENTLMLFKDGVRTRDYCAFPYTNEIDSVKIVSKDLMMMRLYKNNLNMRIERTQKGFAVKTEYGIPIKLKSSLFLANSAILVYDGKPVGIVTNKEIKELK